MEKCSRTAESRLCLEICSVISSLDRSVPNTWYILQTPCDAGWRPKPSPFLQALHLICEDAKLGSIYPACLLRIVTNGVRSETLAEALIAMLNVSPMPRALLPVIFPGRNKKKEIEKRKIIESASRGADKLYPIVTSQY